MIKANILCFVIATSSALGYFKFEDYPMKIPSAFEIPNLPQLSPPPQKQPFVNVANTSPLWDDSQIMQIDFSTKTALTKDKQYHNGTITIKTADGNSFVDNDVSVRLTGDNSLRRRLKNFYFKTKKGNPEFFGEWDRFSLKKSVLDYSGIREKIGSDIMISMGYLPRQVSFAAVRENGNFLGIYQVMQRMRKQWVKRTFGNDALTGKQGSQYKGKRGNFRDNVNEQSKPKDLQSPFEKVYANKEQCGVDLDGKALAHVDLLEFALKVKELANIPTAQFSEANKETLRNLVDYETFARAAALAFYSGDQDGYFFNQQANFEWYHDILDGKWKLLKWDIDDGFEWPVYNDDRLFTLYSKNEGNHVDVVVEACLKDEQYKVLYQSILHTMATQVLPPYEYADDIKNDRPLSEKPSWVKRWGTFIKFYIENDRSVVPNYGFPDDQPMASNPDGTFESIDHWLGSSFPYVKSEDGTENIWYRYFSHREQIQTIWRMEDKSNGPLRGIIDRSKQVIIMAEAQNWELINVVKPPLPSVTATQVIPFPTVAIPPLTSTTTQPTRSNDNNDNSAVGE
eukprot:Pgem_evm1s10712